ncbi:hypothetical protein WJX84_012097 [Apatococcus fuscideae]|uniref:Uncharacterized protein n=1 Tax=Apatococcus fuscideae TaxID=2026836 RepID=A0AAW1SB93_9CHLO
MSTSSDTWRPWVWAAFAFNTLFASLFAILCWATFSEFHNVIHDEKSLVPAGERTDWRYLFQGAAGSAFFAVILVVVFVVASLYYMVLTSFHLANIATHFLSFEPVMHSWVHDHHANFSLTILTATYVMGYVSTVFFLAFTVLMMIMGEEQAKGAHERLVPNDHA